MLPLGLEQGRRGGRGGGGGGHARATVAWHSPSSGRPLTHDPGINIRQKISQWEDRSQQDSSPGDKAKAHAPILSRTLSGDVLGNGVCNDGRHGGPQGKANSTRTKSLGLDFRENQVRGGHAGVGRKSDPQQSHPCLSKTAVPESKQFTVPSHTRTTDTSTTKSPVNRIITTNGQLKAGCILDIEIAKPLPQSVDDHGENLPPGNFYTSRGFWRRLEGDRLFWEKGRDTAADPQRALGPVAHPPPKPQRTFQYQGTDSNPGHWVQWDNRTPPSAGQFSSRSSGRPLAHPPSFPPPPCPVTHSNGFSRHKKNR